MEKLFQQLLQAAEDLKFLIDIQPSGQMKDFAGEPVRNLPSYRSAEKAIDEAKSLLDATETKRAAQG